MNKFDRVTAILIHLQSRRLVTAQALSERFEVSLRTIYRDIETLCNAGVPIIGEVGVGYSMMEGYRLPPVMFTQEEAIAFLMAEKILTKYADTQNINHFQSALFKVKSVLRSAEKKTAEEMDDRISVVKNENTNALLNQSMPLIMRSLTDKEALQIRYLMLVQENNQVCTVEPIGIFNDRGIWIMVAYEHDAKTYRHFRTDRIAQIKLTGKPFSKKHISLNDYLGSQRKAETVYKPIIRIRKEIAHYIEEQKHLYGFVSERELDENIEMTFQTTCLQTFSRWFLTIADGAKIVAPSELQSVFKQVVSNISKNI